MKVVVFTSSGLRHKYLVNQLISSGHSVEVFKENIPPKTVSGSTLDTEELIEYFKYVSDSEKKVFSIDKEGLKQAKFYEIEFGTLSSISLNDYIDSGQVDLYLVFGSSWIKEPLINDLIANKSINLHMGVSPYFRGTACNFWAQKDGYNSLIGGTIHYLDEGLDSGAIIKQVTLPSGEYDRFDAGMLAVKYTIDYLVKHIDKLKALESYIQDKKKTIRYSRKKEFTSEIARVFLELYSGSKTILVK